jgi:hypothetical protein
VTNLVVEGIHDIQALEEEDENHRVRDASPDAGGLRASHAYIDQQPKDHAWTKLVERFYIQRSDCGVQLSSNVEL